MKYFFMIILIVFIGCDNHHTNKIQETNKTIQTNKQKIKQKPTQTNKLQIKQKIIKIKIDDLNFTQKSNTLIYNFKQNKILVFLNNNKDSKLQINELKKLKQKYYIIKNQKIKQYFNILTFPTIIITKDNNHTKKYEGFMPHEVLKYEIKEK